MWLKASAINCLIRKTLSQKGVEKAESGAGHKNGSVRHGVVGYFGVVVLDSQ